MEDPPMEIRDDNRTPEFRNYLANVVDNVVEKVGIYLSGKIAEKITLQDPSWPKLSPVTIKAKKSTKAWIDTGEIFGLVSDASKSVLKTGHFPDDVAIKVGIHDHEKAFIAMCLEYGTNGGSIMAGGRLYTWNHIPERPLFRLVFIEEEENLTTRLIPKWIDEELEKFPWCDIAPGE